MTRVNRRRFIKTTMAIGGSASVLSGCRSTPADEGVKNIATQSLPELPSYFKKPLDAPAFHPAELGAAPTGTRVTMIIRGLCAYILRPDSVDVVLMHHTINGIEHHPVISASATSVDPSNPGSPEMEPAPNTEEVRWWDIRNMLVTVGSEATAGAPQLVVNEHEYSMENPWTSWRWQLDLARAYGNSVRLKDLNRPDHHVAAIVRLTHGVLESAVPGRRYGNTGLWRITDADGKTWVQALSDTVVYTLELPAAMQTVSLIRTPLERPNEGVGGNAKRTDPAPIILKAGTDGDIPCGVVNEVNLVQREYTPTLDHNHVFQNLFESGTARPLQKAPALAAEFKDRGLTRNGRSFLWGELQDPKTFERRNLCDPNCNGAFYRTV